MKEVKSSNIAKVGFDKGKLSVQFTNGTIWDYADVPADTHRDMMAADSVGSFFAKNVRGKFTGTKRETEKSVKE